MNKISTVIGLIAVAVIMTSLLPALQFADAHPHTGTVQAETHTHEPQTELTPINEVMGIEKTMLFLHASSANTLPWGFVEGKIANHVSDYPVIIQIFDEEGEATHFAQTNVEEDGSYEYRFRVRNVDNGETINIFEGDYMVKIFKVVYLSPDSNQV